MYSTRDDVELVFGKTNIERWADLDNNSDSEYIQSRIDYFGEIAAEMVDGDLSQCAYSVPFAEPYPKIIIHLAALKQGMLLYDGRRVVDDENENQISAQEKEYEMLVDKINADTFSISGLSRNSTKPPKVVQDSTNDDTYSEYATRCG